MTTLAFFFLVASQTYNLPPGLLEAVCLVESDHNTQAHNPRGGGSPSYGVCQIKRATAQLMGFSGDGPALQEPALNTLLAAGYLHRNIVRYKGDVYKAIAAYNAGKYRQGKDGKALNKKYVTKVYNAWHGSKNSTR